MLPAMRKNKHLVLASLIFMFQFSMSTTSYAQMKQVKSPPTLSADLSNFLTRKKTVESIGQRLFRANADACPLLLPEFKAKTHRLKDYPRDLREAAEKELNAEESFKIYEVSDPRPNGLEPGDVLLNNEGEPSSEIDKDVLNYRQGGFLKVRRDGQFLFIAQKAPKICPYAVTILHTKRIRAKAKGVEVFLSLGLIDFAENKDELALIIGHELAHLTQGHSNAGPLGTTKDKSLEFLADQMGLDYAIRAGYDPHRAIEFWQRWAGGHEPSARWGKNREKLKRYEALKEYLENAL